MDAVLRNHLASAYRDMGMSAVGGDNEEKDSNERKQRIEAALY